MVVEQEKIQCDGGPVSAVWDHADRAEAILLLGHGAGGTLAISGLARFAAAMAARGVTTMRFNFPYAEVGRRVPDRRPILEGCYRTVASHAGERSGSASRLFLGGRSMGGRIASHLVAAGFPARGLFFLGYPLHPPDRPDELRDAHLTGISVPMLFLQGSLDAFARPDLLARTLARLSTATLHLVQGADHSLAVRGRRAEDIVVELADVTAAWLAGPGRPPESPHRSRNPE